MGTQFKPINIVYLILFIISYNTSADIIVIDNVSPGNIDTNPVIDNGDSVQVGPSGNGSLEVNSQTNTNGNTQIQAGRLVIGASSSGNGDVVVDGGGVDGGASILLPGAPVLNSGFSNNRLEVGQLGTGSLTIQNGGLVDATVVPEDCLCSPVIANGAGSNGTLTVTGEFSRLETLQFGVSLGVVDGGFGTPGADTNGTLNVFAGGTVNSSQIFVGGEEVADGFVNIDGPGSSINVTNWFTIGGYGEGYVNLTNSGNLTSDSIQIGQFGNAHGEININSGSTVTTGFLDTSTDTNTTGNFSVNGVGSTLNADDIFMAQQGQSDASVTDNGVVNVSGIFTVGNQGNGTLNVTSGGQINTTNFNAGSSDIGDSEVNISGAGSGVNVSALTIIDSVTNAEINVSDGGVLNTNVLAVGVLSNGLLNINTGGTVNVTGTDDGEGAVIGLFPGSTGEVIVDGATSSLNVDKELAIGSLVGQPGGDGTVTLLNGGVINSALVNVNPTGRLEGNGTINGNVVNNGGTIGPGLSPGVITINGDFDFIDGLLEIEIGGLNPGSDYDVLNILGNATFLGTIALTFVDGFAPQTSDTFNFFDIAGTVDPVSIFDILVGGLELGWEFSTGFDANGKFVLTSLSDGVALPATVPEPTTLALIGFGLAGLGLIRRKRYQ